MIYDDRARIPASYADDVAYVRGAFLPMASAVRPLVEARRLPLASYVLPDGTPMVPADHAQLLDDAGGRVENIHGLFRERFVAAGGDPRQAESEYRAWLNGGYGVCLRRVSPEMIVAKDALMGAVTALAGAPEQADTGWLRALRCAVDALDAIERPFARFDRQRFGGPVSRDRLVTAIRDRFPAAWQDRDGSAGMSAEAPTTARGA